MLLTGREIEIIAVAVVAIAAALGSRRRWKYRAKTYKEAFDRIQNYNDELTKSFYKVRNELYTIKPKYSKLVIDMRELCRERNNPSKVESIINRWVKTFNNPNP